MTTNFSIVLMTTLNKKIYQILNPGKEWGVDCDQQCSTRGETTIHEWNTVRHGKCYCQEPLIIRGWHLHHVLMALKATGKYLYELDLMGLTVTDFETEPMQKVVINWRLEDDLDGQTQLTKDKLEKLLG